MNVVRRFARTMGIVVIDREPEFVLQADVAQTATHTREGVGVFV